MRKITITQELEVDANALNRNAIKRLRENGFNVSTMSIAVITAEDWDDFIDAVVSESVNQNQIQAVIDSMGDLPPKEYRRVCREFIAETWGAEEEEKNSWRSGGHGRTQEKKMPARDV